MLMRKGDKVSGENLVNGGSQGKEKAAPTSVGVGRSIGKGRKNAEERPRKNARSSLSATGLDRPKKRRI